MGDQASVTNGLFLFIAAFLATGVEMVEATTIILATGITRGWRSTFVGAGAAAVILAVITAVFGLALKDLPLAPLRIVVGTFLLIFGLQWLRKAILRYGGLIAYHDEARIFDREVRSLREEEAASTGGLPAMGVGPGVGVAALDWQAFVVAFKGVLLEGLEAVFIVVTFGLNARAASLGGVSGVGLAAVGGVAALVVVAIAAAIAHRPLSAVPENTMKIAVGLLLASFGTFWAGEGVGVDWPLGDVTILLLLAFYCLVAWLLVTALRAAQRGRASGGEVAHP
jgi:uncharacterized membrane protein